ncbi:putative cytosol aminopeptidase [Nymphon striatum]|nr:putative cytosol aminopeptidase [Nymphon striatum]
MRWNGGEKDKAPLALVGKGVVFDTGGISLKPAAGMEDMTMDMGGAGVVAGVMHALARRKAKANVVGLVGLVENMPSGNAVRPGDVVTSMKGDTIEVVNTDAEGRLVLCDVMWHAQETLKPAAMIDLATLTGACIIALGHENAAVYSNDDTLCNAFLKSAKAEGEGAWHMPMGQAYDDLLKSPVADMKNIGGRAAGSVTAAQFLGRFVQKDRPIEATLPMLLGKALEAGWRVSVRGTDANRMAWLDEKLWASPEDGFLPHGLAGGAHDGLQPILLGVGASDANSATCVMCVDGANVESDEVESLEAGLRAV